MEFKNTGSALLVMDMQFAVINNLASYSQLIENVSMAIKKARNNGMPVIYVIINFRAGMPEVSMNNKVFGASKAKAAGNSDVSAGMNIFSAIAPSDNDLIVTKRRVSAFSGSDLEVLLRSIGVKKLYLTGVATSGVVLSTLCEAADKDYDVTILSDCCADYRNDVHQFLIEKVFPFQGTVKTLAEFETNH